MSLSAKLMQMQFNLIVACMLPLVACTSNLLLALYIFTKGAFRDLVEPLTFSLVSIAVSCFGEFLMHIATNRTVALIGVKAMYSFLLLIAYFLLLFIIRFLRISPRALLWRFFSTVTIFLFSIVLFTSYIVYGVGQGVYRYDIVKGRFFTLFMFYKGGTIYYGLYLLVKQMFRSSGLEKERIKLVLAGLCFPALGNPLVVYLLPRFGLYFPATSAFTIPVSILFSIATLRYRLIVIPKGRRQPQYIGKYDIQPGYGYILKGCPVERSFEIFVDQLLQGRNGLCITRHYPEIVREKYDIAHASIVWITTLEGEDRISPRKLDDLKMLIRNFAEHSKTGAIMIDCIDYLIAHNGYTKTLLFVKEVKDIASLYGSILLIPLDPRTMRRRMVKLFEREMIVVKFSRFPPYDIIDVMGINREAFKEAK